MATTHPIITDQVNVITLKRAKDWHKSFKVQNKQKGFDPGDFPNSIVIPFADIEQIVHDFRETVQRTVNGVRIYFIIKPEKKENGKLNISCICVPTTGPHANEPDVTFTDMIIKATLKDDASEYPNRGGSNGDSGRSVERMAVTDDSSDDYASIYDVTRPCPPFCDPESPINEE